MRKFIVATSLVMMSFAPQASTEINVTGACVDQHTLNTMLTIYGELPVVRGISAREVDGQPVESGLVLFVNPSTHTFTVVERTGENTFCLIAAGTRVEAVSQQVRDAIMRERNRPEL